MSFLYGLFYGLAILAVLFFLIVWGYKLQRRKLVKKYKEEEDLSKHGEQRRKTETRQSGTREFDVKGNHSVGKRNSVQATTVTATKPNISRNKNTNKVDTLFRNIRRTK